MAIIQEKYFPVVFLRLLLAGIVIVLFSMLIDVAVTAPSSKSGSSGKKPLFAQDFKNAPPAAWLNMPIGPVYGFIHSKFGMRDGPYFEVTHETRGGIANSPFIRVRVPDDYPYAIGSDHYFAPNMSASLGEKRFRVGNWRGCTRWSGDPAWSGVRQKLYYQILDGFIVEYNSMRGSLR